MDPAGSDRRESGSGSVSCEAAVLGLVSTRNPGRMPGGPPWLTAGEIRQGTQMPTSTITRAPSEESQFRCRNDQNENQERTIHARRRTDYEARGPDPGIACSQRDRAQNPVNTTRTCNKLPDVYV